MWSAIETDGAPRPIAPYAQGVDAGSLVFVSGQLGIDPATSAIAEDVGEETRRVLANIAAVLEASGLSMRDVVKTTIFMTDFDDYAAMNEAYVAAFGHHRPARSAVAVAGLPLGALVEVEAWARSRGR